jgi:hypothetical protein
LQVPNAPTIGTATAGAGSASVTFTAPSNVGGSAITSYTVISSPGSIIGTGASSPITVSGLTNGTAYTFTVVATNAYGTGPASAASNSVTPLANYIEAVFSTWLYTGNTPSTNTITNSINLSGKGGLVWCKQRTGGSNSVWDTVRGAQNLLITNQTAANLNIPVTYPAYPDYGLLSFNSNGFTLGKNWEGENNGGASMVSWTFREQAKFFDVVTYTGTGSVQNIAHNLGSTPGCIIIKRTNSTSNWAVYHRGVNGGTTPQNYFMLLSTTDAQSSATSYWNNTAPTDTQFTVGGGDIGNVNYTGSTYVAYLFAHDAGGFGASGTDNVISCGPATVSGNATSVTLGYEPQWVMMKRTSGISDWFIVDNMRGFSSTASPFLRPNTSGGEGANTGTQATATGFTSSGVFDNGDYIYVAIRRGPMAVPTVGTSVFTPIAYTGNSNLSTSTTNTLTNGFAADMAFIKHRDDSGGPNWGAVDKLRGSTVYLQPNRPEPEDTFNSPQNIGFNNTQSILTGFSNNDFNYNYSINTFVQYAFQRAPGFFDEVCYAGNSVANQPITHNLTVAPELIIVRVRNGSGNWYVYNSQQPTYELRLNSTATYGTLYNVWGGTATATQFYVNGDIGGATNNSGSNYVAYLFATVSGVSKVGTYTGTGALQTVVCGFTTGARFVLIKRTDVTGNWYVYDSARGITSGNDPYMLVNTASAEVNGTNYVDSTAAGFQVTAAAPADLNAVGGTYIFLAIA